MTDSPFSNKLFLKLFFMVLVLSFFTSLYLNSLYIEQENTIETNTKIPRAISQNLLNKFQNETLAYLILKELDVYEHLTFHVDADYSRQHTNKYFLGMERDEHYCEKHRAYFVSNVSSFFKEKNFLTDYQFHKNLRSVIIPQIGKDLLPHTSRFNFTITDQSLPFNATTFFTFELLYYKRSVGKEFSCLTQMSNHIPGHVNLYRKDHVGNAVAKYTESYKSKPQCFNSSTFFPKTWVLTDFDQCYSFFVEFNSPKYLELKKERKIVYFRKIGADVHEGKGVFPVTDKEEESIRDKYKNGTLCGQVKDNNLMQEFIYNPFLIDGHKTDFRVTILIASTNPTMVYFNDGFMRVSLEEFSKAETEKTALVTNLNLVSDAFIQARVNGTYRGKTEEELRANSVWSFEKMQTYLLEKGIVQDSNWLNNYFRPQLKKMIVHLIRMAQGPFAKSSSVFEFFGLDILMDQNLNLWFLEGNARPAMEGYSGEAKDRFVKLMKDSFEVLYGLLRSRIKRIVGLVNKITTDEKSWKLINNGIRLNEFESKRVEFKKITMNYFEPEFEPSSTNGLHKIIDENLSGVGRYANLLEEHCM